jgi:hypothetical protein
MTCIDAEAPVSAKRRQRDSDRDAPLPDITARAWRLEEISSDAPHGSLVSYMIKQSE